MESTLTRNEVVTVAIGLACLLAPTALADIDGFNRLDGWNYLQRDAGVPADVGDDFVQLTTGGTRQVRNIWYETPQDITQFEASFTYRAANIGAAATRHGLSFILQNDPRGVDALGTGFNATGFGFDGISPSAGVTIELDTGPGLSYTGFYRDGVIGGGSVPTTPLNAFDGQEIEVQLIYDGSLLSVSMRDAFNEFPTKNYVVSPSFADALGSTTAYIGFGASTGAQRGSDQFISDFRFRTVPAPGAAALLALAGLGVTVRRRR